MGDLRVRVLGGLEVEGFSPQQVGSRKARTLVKVLALAPGRAVPVATVVDALWPDGPPSRPADQVGVLVSRLRGVLGADRLVREEGGYRLACDWLDVVELEARVAEARARLAVGATGAAGAVAEAAMALARGRSSPTTRARGSRARGPPSNGWWPRPRPSPPRPPWPPATPRPRRRPPAGRSTATRSTRSRSAC